MQASAITTAILHLSICLARWVNYYIKYGWDQYLVDPDRGANYQKKLTSMLLPESLSYDLLRALPKYDDPLWTSRLYDSSKVRFSTIYHLLVDRKVSLKKISYFEEIVERAQDSTSEEKAFQICCKQDIPIDYTRTLEKAFIFFKDGHVQDINYHPFPQKPLQKDRVYYKIHRMC